MFLRRLFPAVPLLLAVSSAAAQQSSGSNAAPSAAKINPYLEQRSPAYTSFDNPYAPGGIYDPNRGQRPGSSSGLGKKRLSAARRSASHAESSDSNGGGGASVSTMGSCGNAARTPGGCYGAAQLGNGASTRGVTASKHHLASKGLHLPGEQAEITQRRQIQQMQKLPQ